MKNRTKQVRSVLLGTTLIGSLSSQATLLLYEGFDANDYTAGEINGQTQVGDGYSGANWNSTSDFVAGGLTYPGLQTTAGFHLSRDNGEVQAPLDLTPGGTFGSAGLVGTDSKIGGAGVTGTIYFSVLARKDLASNSFAGFQVYDGGTEGFGVGQVSGGNAGAHKWLQGGGNDTIGTTPIPWVVGDVNLYVFKMDFDSVDPTTATVWHNPDPSLSEAVQSADISSFISNAAPNGGFDTLRFRGGTTWSYDEVRIGTSWEDVTPTIIPEPGTSLLSLLALSALSFRRSRRK